VQDKDNAGIIFKKFSDKKRLINKGVIPRHNILKALHADGKQSAYMKSSFSFYKVELD